MNRGRIHFPNQPADPPCTWKTRAAVQNFGQQLAPFIANLGNRPLLVEAPAGYLIAASLRCNLFGRLGNAEIAEELVAQDGDGSVATLKPGHRSGRALP